MVSFHSKDDVQLWHTRVGRFQLPFFCQPVTVEGLSKAYHIKNAVICNPATHRKVAAELDEVSTWKTVDGWVVIEDVFLKMFQKAEGITPTFYYMKDGDPVNARDVEIEVMESQFDQHESAPTASKGFVEDLYAKSGVDQLPVLKALWNAICNHMAYWLLIEQKPIDFGWFKIHAFPVRANWKQILIARHRCLPSIGRMTGEDRITSINENGIAASLQETTLIALKGDRHEKRVDWTVEVEMTKAWDDYVNALELHRLAHSANGTDYPSWWGSTWYGMRSCAIDALLRFASQCGVPAATLGEGGSRSRSGFVEFVPNGRVVAANVDDVPVSGVVSNSPAAVRLPDGSEAGFKQTQRLSKMPVVRLRLPDMRTPRRR